MAAKPLPEQSVLLQLLRYEPETGKLFWNRRPVSAFPTLRIANGWNTQFAGKEAFTAKNADGYKIGTLLNGGYNAQRIIFKMMTGEEPAEVDHRDGNRANNRWTNLRPSNRVKNNRNAARRRDNASGITGVYWDKSKAKWRATIGKRESLGTFACLGAAINARKLAQAEQGYSQRHGTLRDTIIK